MTTDNNSSLLNFMLILGDLKTKKRTGWILRHIPEPESIADHMYRMAIMAMLLEDKSKEDGAVPNGSSFDKNRCVKIALVHDMCEAIVGDITPHCGVSVEEKHRIEKEAMIDMCGNLGKETASEILSLYEEYENQTTVEAEIVKDLDRFEMILQAYEYEKSTKRPENPQFLEEFFEGTKGKFKNLQIQQWVFQLYKMRAVLHSGPSRDKPADLPVTNGTAAQHSDSS